MEYSLIIKNGTLIDVRSQRLISADLMIRDGIIARIGKAAKSDRTENLIDADGQYISPGFIDSHLHIESSLLSPLAFAQKAVTCGTTSVFVDPHEIANVCGRKGIALFLDQAELMPMDMFIGIPSCVPTTDFEDAGASITFKDIKELIHDSRVYGLGEMMNYPAIIHGHGDLRERCIFVYEFGKIVDGHCPGLSAENLDIYISNGKMDGVPRITSDHEVSTYDEALEKSRKGIYVALRYGSASKEMENILPDLINRRDDLSMFMLCTDDPNLEDLYEKGHMDRIIRRAKDIIVENSEMDQDHAAILAISLATFNPSRYFSKYFRFHNLPEIGEIAVGRRANLVILSSLCDLKIRRVIYAGETVALENEFVGRHDMQAYDYSDFLWRVYRHRKFSKKDFTVHYKGNKDNLSVKVIEIDPDSILTRKREIKLPLSRNEIKADCLNDIAKIAVIERHRGTGQISLGFVKGLGIKNGAIASTISHDSHNLVTVGVTDSDMARAVNYLCEYGGGMAVAHEDDIAGMPLEIGGLMTTKDCEKGVSSYRRLLKRVKKLGVTLDNIFLKIAFLSLPVIPELRITNRGLVDVEAFKFVRLY
jgi:adenine deaminase